MIERLRYMESRGLTRGGTRVNLIIECFADDDVWDKDECFAMVREIMDGSRPILEKMIDAAAPKSDAAQQEKA